MDFTEIYKQSAALVAFSPGAHFILTAVQDRLIVRRADSFEITRAWQFDSDASPSQTFYPYDLTRPPPGYARPKSSISSSHYHSVSSGDRCITHTGWSSDSEYLLAACAKRGVINVFKLRDESWSARIDSGAEGLTKAEWAPDGRSILCFSEWGLRVTIWSLVTGSATYIQFPLHPDRGYTFRDDGRYFVLAERHKSKDTVGVYDASESYRLVRHYPLPTSSMASLALSPTGNHLAVWEGPLEYKLYIVSLTGDLLGTFCPQPDPGYGIRTVAWHPSGFFIAVAGWDDKIYILDSLTWGPVAVLDLQNRIPNGVTIWREPLGWLEATQGRGFLSFERVEPPHALTLIRPDLTKPNPKCGAVQLAFNVSGSLLLARFESAPAAVYLFSFPSPAELDAAATSKVRSDGIMSLVPRLRSVLLLTKNVTSAKWNPVRKGSLAVCCGGGSLYLWSDEWVGEGGGESGQGESDEVAECVGVPARKFETRDLKWSPDGKGLILFDKETFCCAFEVEESEDPVSS